MPGNIPFAVAFSSSCEMLQNVSKSAKALPPLFKDVVLIGNFSWFFWSLSSLVMMLRLLTFVASIHSAMFEIGRHATITANVTGKSLVINKDLPTL